MFKFLRKYSVWILGFGGTLLLIAFLAPNVIQQLAQRAGYAGTSQATVGDNESVGYDQWQQILAESQIIDRLGVTLPGIGSIESPSHWFLLTREADLAGLTPSTSAVSIDATTLNNISRNTGVPLRIVLETLAHLEGVQRLIQTYQVAGRFSDRRIRDAADTYLSSVAIETVVIPTEPSSIDIPAADLVAQFDTWKDTAPGEGDRGFGYRLPDRFKVEWVQVPVDSIRQAASNSDDFTTRDQRRFWRRNENDPRFPKVESSTKIPEVVTKAYLDKLTIQSRDAIARTMSEQLRLPRRGFDEFNGFVDLPDTWGELQVSLEQLAATIQTEFSIDLPVYGSMSEWLSTADAESTPTIGKVSASNLGDTPVTFTTLVSAAKEFDGNGIYRVQERVAAPVLETEDGGLIVFRLTNTDASRSPVDLDEVYDAVRQDVARLNQWDAMMAELSSIQDVARTRGLLQVAMDHGVSVSRPQPVSLVDAGVPAILDEETRRTLMSQSILTRLGSGETLEEMVSSLPSLRQTDAAVVKAIVDRTSNFPMEIPITDLPAEDRIFVIPSEENMALVVVRVTSTIPASLELAMNLSGGTSPILQTLMTVDELGGTEGIGEAFSLATLTDRHKFKRGRSEPVETTN